MLDPLTYKTFIIEWDREWLTFSKCDMGVSGFPIDEQVMMKV
jgi:hypothetical protein